MDPAGQVVEAGLRALPASARLIAMRSVIEAEAGRYESPQADFERANSLNPGQGFGAVGLSALYTGTGLTDKAVDTLRQQLRKSPNDPTLKAAACLRRLRSLTLASTSLDPDKDPVRVAALNK
jgi:predicted Zn-dependent protease